MVAPSYNCSVEKCKFTHLKFWMLCSNTVQPGMLCFFLKRWKEKIHLPGKKSGLPFLFFAGLPYGFLEDLEQLTFYTGPYCSDPFTGSAYFLQYFKRNTFRPATSTVKNSFFLYAIHFPWAVSLTKPELYFLKEIRGLRAVFFLTMPFLILGISKSWESC